ncbi:hypothetical protein [Chryseobacterium sp.]|uniref:hypothetical protein n=1 Tax=Chryseobacterium sp. TaxID=1871047 RepID=UPI003219A2A2
MNYNYTTESRKEVKENVKVEKSNLKTIIITSIATAILTASTQYLLQKNQLSNEQDYWIIRYNIENIQSTNNVRLKLMEDISDGILQLEVQAKEIKIQNASVKYSNNSDDIKKLTNLMIQYHKDLYKVSSKMEIASIYFDKNVDNKLLKLGDALTENYQNNLVKIPVNLPNIPELNLDFETIEKLPKAKKEVFEEMLKNMNNDFEKVDK